MLVNSFLFLVSAFKNTDVGLKKLKIFENQPILFKRSIYKHIKEGKISNISFFFVV